MTFTIVNRLFLDSNLKNSALLLAIALAHHVHRNRGDAWPSIVRLAKYIRRSERQVQRLLRQLAEMGVITVQFCAGPRGVNRYRFAREYTEPLPKCAPDKKQRGGDIRAPAELPREQREKKERDAFSRGFQFWTPGGTLAKLALGESH